jgi:hypothetical protein
MPSWDPVTSTLSNPFLSARVETRHGGRIVSLQGAGGELTRPADPTSLAGKRVPYKFGLLSLQLWQDSYWHNDLCHSDWPVTGTTISGTRVEATLTGKSKLWAGLGATRTYRLTDAPWIDVLHNLDPGSTTHPYLPPSFWFSNAMPTLGTTFVSGPNGVVDFPRFPQDQSWCYQPTEGWIGWISRRHGLAIITEAPHLRHMRIVHLDFDRVEWIRRRVDTVEQAVVRLIPFEGLSRVDGVGEAGVVGAGVEGNDVRVELYPIRTGQAVITISASSLAGSTQLYGRVQTHVVAGKAISVRVPVQAGVSIASRGWWRGSVEIGTHPLAATGFRIPVPDGFQRDLRSALPSSAPVVELPRADSAHRLPPRSFHFDALPVPLPNQNLARPLNVRLRVLAFVPIEAGPTLLALTQRFNFDLTHPFVPATATTPTGANGIAGQSLSYELGDRYDSVYGDELIAVWAAALDPAESYDVILIVINHVDPWSLLPQILQANILGRVQAGTGLVIVHRNPPGGPNPETTTLNNILPLTISNTSDYLGPWHPVNDRTVRGLPWHLMAGPGFIYSYSTQPGAATLLELEYGPPPPTLMPLLARTQYGAGRVLDLAWGPQLVPFRRPTAFGAEGFENFRYDLDLLGRVIFDAANRFPAVAVQDVALAGSIVTVQLEQVSPAPVTFDLDWQVRDRFGALLGSGRQNFTTFPPGGIAAITVPSGSWACDVVVTPTAGTSSWGGGAQILNAAFSPSPNLQAYDRSQTIQVTPTLPSGATHAVIDLVDGMGRICARAEVPAGGTGTLGFVDISTPTVEIRLHALNMSGALIGQGFLQTKVSTRTGFDGWPLHFWNSDLALPHPLQVRRLAANASLGVPAYFLVRSPYHNSIGDPELVAAADRIGVPYVIESSNWLYTAGGQTPSGAGSAISLTDTQQTIAGQNNDRALADSLANANVLYYRAADDEPDPPRTDVCSAPRTLEWFRTWLASLYSHSDTKLQAAWGPGFTLPTAVPGSYANVVAQFSTTETYAPWVDHRRFMMTLFSEAPSWARAALRQADHYAMIGSSGDYRTSMAAGRDWWVRGRALDVVGRYATSTRFELAELGTLSIPWTGYDDPDPIIHYRFAYSLGLGDPGLALFAESTLVNPDLSLAEVGRDLAAALLPTRRGVGRLFSLSEPAADGVFVMSSPDSSAVLAIHGYESLGVWAGGTPPSQPDLGTLARENVHDLLAAMGIGWRAINPADVELGALERNGARVLILPMCAALSEAACGSISRWVKRGGHLIADLLPGTFSDHGRLRGTGIDSAGRVLNSTNPLDQVFGLTPGARPPLTAGNITRGAASFTVGCADTSVWQVGTASAAGSAPGGQPVWFTNNYGLGTASYLACSFFSNYPSGDPAQPAQRLAMEEQFALLLARAVVSSHAQVTTGGARASSFRIWVRRFGSAELVVLARHYSVIYPPVESETDGVVTFSNSAHTYDLDEGTYLGFGYRLDIHVDRYTFRRFGRLPYRVLGVSVATSASAVLGQSLTVSIQVQVLGGRPGLHLIQIDMVDGNSNAIRYLSRQVTTLCGAATVVIPTALNDPQGRWTVIATDLLTGLQGRARVLLTGVPLHVSIPDVGRVYGIDD